MTVWQGWGFVCLKCPTGCSTVAILAVLKLRCRDIRFPEVAALDSDDAERQTPEMLAKEMTRNDGQQGEALA